MKKLFSLFLILLVTWVQYACHRSPNFGPDFTESTFNEVYSMTDGSIYKNDNLFLGHPTLIRFHPDSFLIIQEMNTPKLIKIIDLKSNTIQEVIPQGKGPGEMIVGWGIETINKDIYAFCGQLRKVIILTPDSLRNFKIKEEFFLSEKQTTRFFPLKTDIMVCLSNVGDDKRITILDDHGSLKSKMGDYPPLISGEVKRGDNNIFQSSISGNTSGNMVILACGLTDVLEIYDIKEGLKKRFQGPLGIQLTAKIRKVGPGTMVHTEPRYMTYRDISANDDEFWVSYIGYKLKEGVPPPPSATNSKIIFSFDWNSKPLRKLLFENAITVFTVDWEGKILYTIEWKNENPEIITYQLNDILK